jgi:hypothetical protein
VFFIAARKDIRVVDERDAQARVARAPRLHRGRLATSVSVSRVASS